MPCILSLPILGAPRGFWDYGRMAIYFQGAGENLYLFSGILGASSLFGDLGSPVIKVNKSLP